MNQGKFVFAQLTEFLPHRAFDCLVDKYDGNKYVKHFTCWNQMLCMLFGKAKEAANSWNQTEKIEELIKVDESSKKIIGKTNVEQWNVNKALHYNGWANFSKQDFAPVVATFKDLYEKVFSCSNEVCQSALQVTFDGAKINGVRCKCGAINWNLNKK